MANPEGGAVQLPLRAEGIQEIFVFYAGAYPIYIQNGHKGAPTQNIMAIRVEGKIAKLNAYQSITPIHIFYRDKLGDKHFLTEGVGTRFGAYSYKAHKKKA